MVPKITLEILGQKQKKIKTSLMSILSEQGPVMSHCCPCLMYTPHFILPKLTIYKKGVHHWVCGLYSGNYLCPLLTQQRFGWDHHKLRKTLDLFD